MSLNLCDKRAILFLPASNPRAIAKARESDADWGTHDERGYRYETSNRHTRPRVG